MSFLGSLLKKRDPPTAEELHRRRLSRFNVHMQIANLELVDIVAIVQTAVFQTATAAHAPMAVSWAVIESQTSAIVCAWPESNAAAPVVASSSASSPPAPDVANKHAEHVEVTPDGEPQPEPVGAAGVMPPAPRTPFVLAATTNQGILLMHPVLLSFAIHFVVKATGAIGIAHVAFEPRHPEKLANRVLQLPLPTPV
jgi:hypothetical protein